MNFIKLDRTETIRLLITGVLMKLRERAGECSEKKEERRGGYVLRASRKGAASAHKIASVSNLLATWACFLAYMTHVYTRVRDRGCRGVSLVSDDRTGLSISPA